MKGSTRGILFVLSAPSGAGKSTLAAGLMEKDRSLKFSVSTTTRRKRDGETDGKDYRFVSEEEFRRKIERGEFAEHAEVHGNLYGTDRAIVEDALSRGQDLLLDIDVQGARKIKEGYPDGVFIFIAPPSLGELERRLRRRRTEDEATMKRRLENARLELNEIAWYDYIIVNDSLEGAMERLSAVVKAERLKSSRLMP